MALQSQQPVLIETAWDSTGYQSDTVLSSQHFSQIHRRTPSDPTLFATPQSPKEPTSPRVSTDGSARSVINEESCLDQIVEEISGVTLEDNSSVTLVKQYDEREARRGLFSFRRNKSKDNLNKLNKDESLPKSRRKPLTDAVPPKQQSVAQDSERKASERNGDVAGSSWFRRAFAKENGKVGSGKLVFEKDEVPLLDGSPIRPGCLALLYKPKTKYDMKDLRDGVPGLDVKSAEQQTESSKSTDPAESHFEAGVVARSDGSSDRIDTVELVGVNIEHTEDLGDPSPSAAETPVEVEAEREEEKTKKSHRRHRSLTALLPKISFKRAVEHDADGCESSNGSDGAAKPDSPGTDDVEGANDKTTSSSASLLCFGRPAVVEGEDPETPPVPTSTGKDDATKLPPGVVGLRNLGNTCFVNAALQCLRFTPGLASQLLGDSLPILQAVSGTSSDSRMGSTERVGSSAAVTTDPSLDRQSSADSASSMSQQLATKAVSKDPTTPVATVSPARENDASAAMESVSVVPVPGGALLSEGTGDTEEAGESVTPLANAQPATDCEDNTEDSVAAAAPAAGTTQGQLAAVFRQLVNDLYVNSESVDPSALFQLLSNLPAGSDFCDGGQHDCQEVLRVILDGLHADLNEAPADCVEGLENGILNENNGDEQEVQKADRLWRHYLAQDNSLITDLFGGQLQSCVHCHKCNKRFTTYEPFWDLSLPLAKESKTGALPWFSSKTPASIQDCLQLFTADELLQGNESFYCDCCKERTSATKKLRIHRFPKVLVLHIKRFKYAGNTREKLTANVSFPLKDLKLRQFATDECSADDPHCSYDLYGVSNHYGNMVGGHYTAACKVKVEGGKEQWYSFSDDAVMKTTPSSVVGNTAYILFYSRQDWAQQVTC